jgi:serine/threonine protein kinase
MGGNSKILCSLADFEKINYDGKEKLGKGSFASVKLVKHKITSKLYALKEVIPKFLPFNFRSTLKTPKILTAT